VIKSKVPHVAAQTQPDAALTPSAEIVAESPSLGELSASWNQAQTLEQLDPVAQALAEMNTPESVEKLLTGIEHIKEWPVRAALAKNLRAVSNPETLQVLLPALLNNYGRGNTILNEISDTIARLAQPETVEDLAALHWQASVQAGQGHKVLRTVASIRNPIAARGLMKVANFSESPALVAAAELKSYRGNERYPPTISPSCSFQRRICEIGAHSKNPRITLR
jgi:HEAT repeat protein